MKFRKLLSALLLTAGVLFVAGFTPADTPAAVAGNFFEALKNCDFKLAARQCYGEMKSDAEEMGRQYQTASPEERKQMQQVMAAIADGGVVLKETKIDGDFAVIQIAVGGSPGKMYLKRIGGEWKIVKNPEPKKAADTPTEVGRKWIEAARNCDFAAAAELSVGNIKNGMETLDKAYKTASPEERKKMQQFTASFTKGAELKNEKINGDLAEIDVIVEGKTQKMCFKKVDGEWKVIDDDNKK